MLIEIFGIQDFEIWNVNRNGNVSEVVIFAWKMNVELIEKLRQKNGVKSHLTDYQI